MTEPQRDPLDVLALSVDRPGPGTAPDPAFAAALRARLEDALLDVRPAGPDDPTRPDDPRGSAMTTTTPAAGSATTTAGAPSGAPAGAARTGPGAAGAARAPGTADVAYVTVSVPDAQVAREFYGEVLGWRFSPGSVADGWEVEGAQPSVGLWGGAPQEPPQVQLCYRVPDLEPALRAVRARGGSAQEPQDKPYGRLVDCTDPAGLRFQLWEPPAG